MARTGGLEVTGLDDLLSALKQLDSRVASKTAIARALRKGAKPILEAGIRNAPDDPDTDGSRVADNMVTRITEQTALEAIARIGLKKFSFVGRFAEFGTAHQSAHAWLRPAFDQNVAEAKAVVALELKREIDKAMKAQTRRAQRNKR